MKKSNKYYSNIFDSIFIYVLVLSQIYCLTSAFKIGTIPSIINISALLFSIYAGIVTTVCSKKNYLVINFFVFVISFSIVFLNYKKIVPRYNYIVNKIFDSYGIYQNLNQLDFNGKTITNANSVLILLSFLLIILYSFFIIRLKRILPVVAISAIFVIPCFVLYTTIPNLYPELALIISFTVLYFKSNIHKINYNISFVSAFFGLLIAGIVVFVAFKISPEKSFERKEWQNDFYYKIEDYVLGKNKTSLDDDIEVGKGIDISELSDELKLEVNLANENQKEQLHEPVMSVTCNNIGIMYLKGVAYANYSDNKWSILNENQLSNYPEKFPATQMTITSSEEDVLTFIKTNTAENVIYTPYFLQGVAGGATSIADVLFLNNNKQKNYTISFIPYLSDRTSNTCAFSYYSSSEFPIQYSYDVNEESMAYKDFVYSTYLQIPESTKNSLLEIAKKKNLLDVDKDEQPYKVANFISKTATYSLQTPRMPNGKDFPIWFLKESKTGYCVHYATTATLMLRAMGIPARYISGYAIELGGEESFVNDDGQLETQITSDNAHTWVEYFDDTIGWVPIEPTPSSFELNNSFADLDEDETIYIEETTAPETIANTSQPQTTQPETVEETIPEPTTNEDISTKKYDYTIINFLKRFVISFLALSFICLILYVRRKILIKLRFNTFTKGTTNERAKNMYRYIIKLSEYSHLIIPDKIQNYVYKARFGNSELSETETSVVYDFTLKCIKRYEISLSETQKLYYKYIIVII